MYSISFEVDGLNLRANLIDYDSDTEIFEVPNLDSDTDSSSDSTYSPNETSSSWNSQTDPDLLALELMWQDDTGDDDLDDQLRLELEARRYHDAGIDDASTEAFELELIKQI